MPASDKTYSYNAGTDTGTVKGGSMRDPITSRCTPALSPALRAQDALLTGLCSPEGRSATNTLAIG